MKYITTLLLAAILFSAQAQTQIRVGAKHFTEGYILSEMMALLLENAGYSVERKYNLGGTMVCFSALREKEIDLYPEYSGTIASEILTLDGLPELPNVQQTLLQQYRMTTSEPFGFNNTYAIVIDPDIARERNIRTISDLKLHPDLAIGLSYEFLKRKDGWDNLAQHYNLPHRPVGLEHGLAYSALHEGKIQLTDAYSTDGEIAKYQLVTLRDDLHFFPSYLALALYRAGLPDGVRKVVDQLAGQISEKEIQELNAQVVYENKSYQEVAASFLKSKSLIEDSARVKVSGNEITDQFLVHLYLVLLALLISIAVAIPLGVMVNWNEQLSGSVIYVTGLFQTIPSIALLAILIPVTGIGVVPAIVALFLYGLLPILRGTVTGLQTVDPTFKKVADSMGMTRWQKLKWVEFPIALPTILAGIRTAAVINVGTATLAAFIGAGGLGEFIVTGLALNNHTLILRGAIPAAAMAIAIELAFELIERKLSPAHLRKRR